MHLTSTSVFFLTSLALASAVHAQVAFSLGPQVGLNVSTASYESNDVSADSHYRAGLQAGLVGSISFGHFALQPALLFAQQGFGLTYRFPKLAGAGGNNFSYSGTTTYRLNYLTLPVCLAYSAQTTGQGIQIFAGPYLSLLVGGHYDYSLTITNTTTTFQGEGQVAAGDFNTVASTSSTSLDTKFHSRQLDTGLQVGLGYRLGNALVQAGYSLGLRNLGVNERYDYGAGRIEISDGPAYYNRAFHFSLTYLLGLK